MAEWKYCEKYSQNAQQTQVTFCELMEEFFRPRSSQALRRARRTQPMERLKKQWLLRARRYVDSCFRRESAPRVDEFAALLQMSREHLTRSFGSATGMTPGVALRSLQLRRAMKLLENTDLSTAEVARAAAYGSTRAFYRAFLRARGMSPSAHRYNAR